MISHVRATWRLLSPWGICEVPVNYLRSTAVHVPPGEGACEGVKSRWIKCRLRSDSAPLRANLCAQIGWPGVLTNSRRAGGSSAVLAMHNRCDVIKPHLILSMYHCTSNTAVVSCLGVHARLVRRLCRSVVAGVVGACRRRWGAFMLIGHCCLGQLLS